MASWRPISPTPKPVAANKTMRARSASFCGVEWARPRALIFVFGFARQLDQFRVGLCHDALPPVRGGDSHLSAGLTLAVSGDSSLFVPVWQSRLGPIISPESSLPAGCTGYASMLERNLDARLQITPNHAAGEKLQRFIKWFRSNCPASPTCRRGVLAGYVCCQATSC